MFKDIPFLSSECVSWEKVWVHSLELWVNPSFWLVLCWCHPRMYVMGKGQGKIFTALRYFFLFSAADRKVYNFLLKTSKADHLSTPIWWLCKKLFFYHFHFNKIYNTQSSEWLRLSLVPELNLLLQRQRMWWNTVSFYVSSWGLTRDPKTRCKLSSGGLSIKLPSWGLIQDPKIS